MITLPKIPDIAKQVESNKTDILSKLDKGSFVGSADDLLSKDGGTVTGTIDIGGIGSSRLVLNNMYFNETYGTKQAMHFGEHYVALGNPTFGEIVASRSHTQGAGKDISEPLFKRDGLTYFIFHTGNSPISKASNGYCKLANGIIVQWGVDNKSVSGYQNKVVSFPISFSSPSSYNVMLTLQGTAESTVTTVCQQEPKDAGSFTLYKKNTNTSNLPSWVKWIAIGY